MHFSKYLFAGMAGALASFIFVYAASAAEITPVSITDFDLVSSTSSAISLQYNSGDEEDVGRYSIFVIQLDGGADTITSVTYGGEEASLLKKRHVTGAQTGGGDDHYYIYGLANPTTGTSTLQITASIAPSKQNDTFDIMVS